MNIYRISQKVNNAYDTFDAAIVAAHDEDEARTIHPDGSVITKDENWDDTGSWCTPLDVHVELIGVTRLGAKVGVILASFRAG